MWLSYITGCLHYLQGMGEANNDNDVTNADNYDDDEDNDNMWCCLALILELWEKADRSFNCLHVSWGSVTFKLAYG